MTGVNVWSGLIHRLFPWRTRSRAMAAPGRAPTSPLVAARLGEQHPSREAECVHRDRAFHGAIGRSDVPRCDEPAPSVSGRWRFGARRQRDRGGARALSGGRAGAPSAFHAPPPPLESPSVESAWHPSMRFEWLSFESGYRAATDDPAASRWNNYDRNHVAHAWVARHGGPDWPWLICLTASGPGAPMPTLLASAPRCCTTSLG